MTPPSPSGLPTATRWWAILCMLLSSFVGVFAIQEASVLRHLQDLRQRVAEAAPKRPVQFPDSETIIALTETQVAVLEGMKGVRGATLIALGIASLVVFMSAAWLVRPHGLPREGARKLLSRALMVAAAIRTADGAQWAVVQQKAGEAAGPVFARRYEGNDTPLSRALVEAGHSLGTLGLAFAVVVTLLVAGGFLLLGQYFRSGKVRALVAQHDQALEQDGG